MMVGWEEKARSIKTGHWAEGFCHFLGQGLSLGSRVCSIRKFPPPTVPLWALFRPFPPRPVFVHCLKFRWSPRLTASFLFLYLRCDSAQSSSRVVALYVVF